ncbi:MAG TPA: hypothetical protein VGM52_07145, partial [Herbaspirillum sp.]
MAAATQMVAATAVVSTYAKLQRACQVFGLVHSIDGEVTVFRDHLARHLSNAVNITGKALGGDNPLRVTVHQQDGAMDAITLLKALSDCEQLVRYKDLGFVSAVEYFVHNQQYEDVVAIGNFWSSDPYGETARLNKLLADLHHGGLRQHVTTQSVGWQKQADARWASIQSGIEGVFAANDTIFACKADLLHQDYVPKNKVQVMTRYDQLTQGQTFTHADVGQVQSWQRAFHTALSESITCQQKLLAWVYVTSYSRITGPYTTAVLLFDGAGVAPDEVHDVLQTSWNTATDGQGYCFHWSSSKCLWAGRIEPCDDIKRHGLLHGLE